MNKLFFTTLPFAFCSLIFQHAVADVNSATNRIINNLGTKQVIDATATCDIDTMVASNGGNLATPNLVLCLAQNLGLTGTASGTPTVTIAGNPITFHYELATPGPTIDSTAYDAELKIWTCGSSCTTTTNFLPAIYTAFNANSSGSINNGVLTNHFNSDSGTIQGSSFIKWDTGSGTSTKSIILNMVDCNASPTGAAYTVYNRTGDESKMNELYYNGSTMMRTALAWNNVTNSGNWQEDNVSGAGGDAPAWGGGWSRSTSGTDYTYSTGSVDSAITINPYSTSMSGANLTSNQALSCSATAGVSSVVDGSNILTTTMTPMGGMTTNPSGL